MSKSDGVPMMYEAFPAVTAMNQVQGFNPLKLLRRTVSPKTGEEVLKLDLQYKKLWFKLANPQGKIRLKPLRITEQLAIYEAMVYLNRDDPAPVSSFTSSISREEAPDGKYIQAAQEEAMDNALTDAGYGLQFSDVSTPASMRHYGSEIPVSKLGGSAVTAGQVMPAQKPVVQVPAAPEQTAAAVQQPPAPKVAEKPVQAVQSAPVKQAVPVQNVTPPAAPAQTVKAPAPQQATAQTTNKIVSQPVAQVQPKPAVPVQEQVAPAPEVHASHSALEVLRGGAPAPAAPGAAAAVNTPAPAAVQTENDQDLPFTFGPAYNNDMTPEEIGAVMTLDQAKAVVVDTGMCKGMTLGEVAEKRPVSLKFYLFGGYRGNNNILKAAAKIVYDQLQNAA